MRFTKPAGLRPWDPSAHILRWLERDGTERGQVGLTGLRGELKCKAFFSPKATWCPMVTPSSVGWKREGKRKEKRPTLFGDNGISYKDELRLA